MQLKALVKNLAKEKGISAQLIMQNYMLERLLERISLSRYQSNFILKGGYLIASIVGLDTRATMDLDTTVKGFDLNLDTAQKVFTEICQIPVVILQHKELSSPARYFRLSAKKIFEDNGSDFHVSQHTIGVSL